VPRRLSRFEVVVEVSGPAVARFIVFGGESGKPLQRLSDTSRVVDASGALSSPILDIPLVEGHQYFVGAALESGIFRGGPDYWWHGMPLIEFLSFGRLDGSSEFELTALTVPPLTPRSETSRPTQTLVTASP
jgi:hypothetical protein